MNDICDSLLETYNTNFLDFEDSRIQNLFRDIAKDNFNGNKGNKTLMTLINNHYYPKDNFTGTISGCEYISLLWNKEYQKLVYIFQGGKDMETTKSSQTKNIFEYFQFLMNNTDVFIDFYVDTSKEFGSLQMKNLTEYFQSSRQTLCRYHTFEPVKNKIQVFIDKMDSLRYNKQFNEKINEILDIDIIDEIITNLRLDSMFIHNMFWDSQIDKDKFFSQGDRKMKQIIYSYYKGKIMELDYHFREHFVNQLYVHENFGKTFDVFMLIKDIFEEVNEYILNMYVLGSLFNIKSVTDQPSSPANIIFYTDIDGRREYENVLSKVGFKKILNVEGENNKINSAKIGMPLFSYAPL